MIVFLFAISVHESAHAWMANRCGDPTARMLGRITLNPIKHIDPIGTVIAAADRAVTAFADARMGQADTGKSAEFQESRRGTTF